MILGKKRKKEHKPYRHLTWDLRLTIEKLHDRKIPIKQIAEECNVHYSTIYRELKRGKTTIHTTLLQDLEVYSSQIGQKKHETAMKNCGRFPEMCLNEDMINYIGAKIKANRSPVVISYEMQKESQKFLCSYSTIYRYVYKGYIMGITYKDLIYGSYKKYSKESGKIQKRWHAGKSIELRDKSILKRNVFGNWEMDTVVGSQGKSKHSLLVLSERMTRLEIVLLLKEHTAKSVVEKLDYLESIFKEKFSKVFKTITTDNGCEFQDLKGMKKSIFDKNKCRSDFYYCHAYCSCERGTNENINRMIRRKIKKGINFDDKNDVDIRNVQDWINDYPRKILNFKSAKSFAISEFRKLRVPADIFRQVI